MASEENYALSELTDLEKEIPCFHCTVRRKCARRNKIDPVTCELMDKWIYSLIKGKHPVEKIPLYLTRRYGDEEIEYEQLSG
ncbi:MAG: hypothetical protein KAR35_04160 [Candidatus Heimdallarchaeota archaeon]|nr:hypothetical protein [Candidatus Heimdallarchaeota archaeon]MCK5048548.1 hypothetical protein [Candidatus Heimdallarchaeota archaeon]